MVVQRECDTRKLSSGVLGCSPVSRRRRCWQHTLVFLALTCPAALPDHTVPATFVLADVSTYRQPILRAKSCPWLVLTCRSDSCSISSISSIGSGGRNTGMQAAVGAQSGINTVRYATVLCDTAQYKC